MSKNKDFLMVHFDLLKLNTVPSKVYLGTDNNPSTIELNLTDKILYAYMYNRFMFFLKNKKSKYKNPKYDGGLYFDTQKSIATALNISERSVHRFVKKWVEHGYMEIVHSTGNRINYITIHSLFGNQEIDVKQVDYGKVDMPPAPPSDEYMIPYVEYDNDYVMSMWEAGL